MKRSVEDGTGPESTECTLLLKLPLEVIQIVVEDFSLFDAQSLCLVLMPQLLRNRVNYELVFQCVSTKFSSLFSQIPISRLSTFTNREWCERCMMKEAQGYGISILHEICVECEYWMDEYYKKRDTAIYISYPEDGFIWLENYEAIAVGNLPTFVVGQLMLDKARKKTLTKQYKVVGNDTVESVKLNLEVYLAKDVLLLGFKK